MGFKIYVFESMYCNADPRWGYRQEGFHAFYKGITPRIMRVAPGQAVTFTVYEYLKDKLEKSGPSMLSGSQYEE